MDMYVRFQLHTRRFSTHGHFSHVPHEGIECESSITHFRAGYRTDGDFCLKVSSSCYISLILIARCRYSRRIRGGESSRDHGMAELGMAWWVTLWAAEGAKWPRPGSPVSGESGWERKSFCRESPESGGNLPFPGSTSRSALQQ